MDRTKKSATESRATGEKKEVPKGVAKKEGKKAMTYLDCFSGIGGFAKGIIQASSQATCVGFSEIDKYAIQTYEHNFPTHTNYGDITKIDTATLPDFDCFVGGFPCPSWSISGKRKGFEDERGELFFDIVRILKVKQPPLFVLENVKGLLSHDKGNSMERICEELCAIGYALDFDVLNSKNFGVPQSRERVFIIGKRLDTLSEKDII